MHLKGCPGNQSETPLHGGYQADAWHLGKYRTEWLDTARRGRGRRVAHGGPRSCPRACVASVPGSCLVLDVVAVAMGAVMLVVLLVGLLAAMAWRGSRNEQRWLCRCLQWRYHWWLFGLNGRLLGSTAQPPSRCSWHSAAVPAAAAATRVPRPPRHWGFVLDWRRCGCCAAPLDPMGSVFRKGP